MDEKEKKYPIGIVQMRWSKLNLSIEQAERIAVFENGLRFHTRDTILSDWEKADYELFVFSEILNKEQLELYIDDKNQRLKLVEEDLVETDQSEDMQKEIAYEMEDIQYLETEFLPGVLKGFINNLFMMHPLRTKYDFLKAEYKSYLDEKNCEIISRHFRYSRTFQPNTLKKALLRHKIEAMYPNFSLFKVKTDAPTKVVTDMLKSHFEFLAFKKDLIMSKIEALKSFRITASDNLRDSLQTKYYAFSSLEDKRSEEEKQTDLYFSLILIDRDYYGFK